MIMDGLWLPVVINIIDNLVQHDRIIIWLYNSRDIQYPKIVKCKMKCSHLNLELITLDPWCLVIFAIVFICLRRFCKGLDQPGTDKLCIEISGPIQPFPQITINLLLSTILCVCASFSYYRCLKRKNTPSLHVSAIIAPKLYVADSDSKRLLDSRETGWNNVRIALKFDRHLCRDTCQISERLD